MRIRAIIAPALCCIGLFSLYEDSRTPLSAGTLPDQLSPPEAATTHKGGCHASPWEIMGHSLSASNLAARVTAQSNFRCVVHVQLCLACHMWRKGNCIIIVQLLLNGLHVRCTPRHVLRQLKLLLDALAGWQSPMPCQLGIYLPHTLTSTQRAVAGPRVLHWLGEVCGEHAYAHKAWHNRPRVQSH